MNFSFLLSDCVHWLIRANQRASNNKFNPSSDQIQTIKANAKAMQDFYKFIHKLKNKDDGTELVKVRSAGFVHSPGGQQLGLHTIDLGTVNRQEAPPILELRLHGILQIKRLIDFNLKSWQLIFGFILTDSVGY